MQSVFILLYKYRIYLPFFMKTKRTKKTTTPTTSSSATLFPKRLKDRDRGLVKSSRILTGSISGVGCT